MFGFEVTHKNKVVICVKEMLNVVEVELVVSGICTSNRDVG